MAYATPGRLAEWTGRPAPPDVARLLARASEDIDAALLTAVYEPAAVAAALADAVCAQVEYWLATGSDGITTTDVWDSVSIGPVSLSGRTGESTSPVIIAGVELAPRAYRTLRRAGLLPGEVSDAW
ncbi:hypothetical protein [Streptomyces fractus]|uniref:hypothetical protein n=1 Tax=Streptomyces fractus TaxID=641806 RepID=UPI003CF7B001